MDSTNPIAPLAQVMLIGYLYSDPTGKHLDSGGVVVNATVCVPGREGYTFFRVSAFGKLAESIWGYGAEAFGPGSMVAVAGSFEMQWWTNRDGKARSTLAVNASAFSILSEPDAQKIEDIKAMSQAAASAPAPPRGQPAGIGARGGANGGNREPDLDEPPY